MFEGSITALITPFRDGAVDDQAFQSLVDWQIREGTRALVPCGTTGEELCIEAAGGRVPVIAGAGSNSTEEAAALCRHAHKAGAEATLIVTPYYNKPTQEGMYQHFKTVAEATDLPLIIYNIPARSVIDMSVETMTRLYQIPNIIGVKDATANLGRVSDQRAAMGPDFVQLSGEDGTALAFMAHGGHGCISVTANVAPRACADFQKACLSGDYGAALAIQDRLWALHSNLFIETSPAPVKYAASLLDLCTPDVRLPLVPIGTATEQKVRAAMELAGLFS